MRRRSPHGSFEGGCDGTMVSIEHVVELHALTLRLGEGALVTDRSMPTGCQSLRKRAEFAVNTVTSLSVKRSPTSL